MRSLIIAFLLLISINGFAQNEKRGTIKVKRSSDSVTTSEIIIPTVEAILTIVDEMPEFPGGSKIMYDFLAKNLVYPAKAITRNANGMCYVTFIVEVNGSLNNIKVLKGVPNCPECDLEALRVAKLMPKWKPGKQEGRVVQVQYTLSLKFTSK